MPIAVELTLSVIDVVVATEEIFRERLVIILPSANRVVPVPATKAPFVYTLETDAIFPPTNKSSPLNWNKLLTCVAVAAPIKRSAPAPLAGFWPIRSRLVVVLLRKTNGAFPSVDEPITISVVAVVLRTKSPARSNVQFKSDIPEGQFVPLARQTAIPPTNIADEETMLAVIELAKREAPVAFPNVNKPTETLFVFNEVPVADTNVNKPLAAKFVAVVD